jgi:hypothetical protein
VPAEAPATAARYGVGTRVRGEETDAKGSSDGLFDVVLRIGAGHAVGGLDATLEAGARAPAPRWSGGDR